MKCSEVQFQLAKSVLSGDLKAAEMVVQTEKPGATMGYTNRKNMPKCAESWNDVSQGMILRAALGKLRDADFYEAVACCRSARASSGCVQRTWNLWRTRTVPCGATGT